MSDSEKTGIEYATKDVHQAAFIWCQPGVRQIKEYEKGQAVYFVFDVPLSESELNNLFSLYRNGEARVDPLLFCAKQDRLRQIIRENSSRIRK